MEDQDRPMTFDEALSYLSLTPYKLRMLTRSGEIPSRKIGQTILYLRSELLAWLASRPLRNGTAG